MTSVSGHLTSLDFADRYKKWDSTPPGALFDAETIVKIDAVSPEWCRFPTESGRLTFQGAQTYCR